MTWHAEIVAREVFQAILRTIRQAGGIITGSCPCPSGYSFTYVTVDR